jgi:hypothetical protein
MIVQTSREFQRQNCDFLFYVIDTGSTGSRGPKPCGDEPVDFLSNLRPYSDAGCAGLPLTLLGAPVSIGETQVTVSRVAKTENLGAASRVRTACARSA